MTRTDWVLFGFFSVLAFVVTVAFGLGWLAGLGR